MRRAVLALCLLGACGHDGGAVRLLTASSGAGAHLVPPGETIRCFGFGDAGELRATAIAPHLDSGLVHHLSLHRSSRMPTDGACTSIAPSTLLYVWSPGDEPLVAPEGTDLELGTAGEDVLVLEAHYLNGSGEAQPDRSGLELTLSEAPSEHAMGIWITGVPVLEIPPHAREHVEARTCTVRASTPVTLYAVSPHMHRLGVALSVEIARDGVAPRRIDVAPFDPAAQRTVFLDPGWTLEPGDRVTTRCVYDNPTDDVVRYGTSLFDEMCFAYFWASPIDALRSDAAFCH